MRGQHIVDDILGHAQLLGRDKDKLHAGIAAHGGHQRVDGAAEFQIAAQTDGQVVEAALFPPDGQQVGQSLGGMEVPAVTGVDDGHTGGTGSHQRSALLRMAHGDNVGVAAHGAHGVGHALALGGGAALGTGKADDIAAQLVHGRLKGQAGTGGGLEEQGGQLLITAGIPVLYRVCDNILCRGNELVQLLHGQIHNINQVTHHTPPLIQLSSEGLLRNFRIRSWSPVWM